MEFVAILLPLLLVVTSRSSAFTFWARDRESGSGRRLALNGAWRKIQQAPTNTDRIGQEEPSLRDAPQLDWRSYDKGIYLLERFADA